MDLAELKAGVADIGVDYRGHHLTVGYRPEMVTEDDLELLEQFAQKSGVELLRATTEPLGRLIVRWSLTFEGRPFTVSDEAIRSLPPKLRVAVLSAIMADFFSAGNASPSDAGSPAAAASEGGARSTPSSSGTPNGPASLPGSSPGSLTLVVPSSGAAGSPT